VKRAVTDYYLNRFRLLQKVKIINEELVVPTNSAFEVI
jgi:hypothetical protein